MNLATTNPHEDCMSGERCYADDIEHCPPNIEYQERERVRRAGAWHVLEAFREDFGWRHYLVSEPVPCGSFIELQAMEPKYDDRGEHSVYKQDGIVVRYEASLRDEEPRVTLHAFFKGHEFVCGLEQWMRFRWPKK